MSAWTEVLTAAALQSWMPLAPVLLLVAVRWLGCLVWLPGLGAAGVTFRMRIALSVLMSIVMLPAVSAGGREPVFGGTLVGWMGLVGSEFVIGSVLGLGVRIVFGALALAGELIDQQAGFAVRQVLDPAGEGGAGPVGTALAWLGAAAILLAPPMGGHLSLVRALLDQFTVIPPGSVETVAGSSLLVVLVQQSLCLAVEVAAPVLAAMSLMTLAAGWLGRSAPRLRADSLVSPIRIAVCVAMLTVATPGFRELLGDRFDALIDVDPRLFEPTSGGG